MVVRAQDALIKGETMSKGTTNIVRGLGFMAGVLKQQQKEPLCGSCISFVVTTESMREAIADFEKSGASVPQEFKEVYDDAVQIIRTIEVPVAPIKQRKIGTCTFPDKACYLKRIRKFFLNIVKEA
jgi:hypothetical protein